ncbi:MAG: zf-HC2 domain-containing protein [Planctomycetaceae bacterium]|nr:zf-HC2 domain-containing protein [Planctomycetaceae bacterium]
MNCTVVKELLSAYFDGELGAKLHQQVQEHVEDCSVCRRELEGFRRLAQLASEATVAPPSAELWQRVESGLDQDAPPPPALRRTSLSQLAMSWNTRRWTTLAALVLIAVTVGILGYRSMSPPHEHHQFAEVFAEYLDRFKSDSRDAQAFLLSKYHNQPVTPESAIDRVGYRPAVAGGLPDGYSVVSTHVVKMPCCTCVECLCQRADGTTLAIFEHEEDEPEWFDKRPAVNVICQSKQCALFELPGTMAASWKSGKRYVTLIGAQSVGEVDKLVAWFSRTSETGNL